jgi:1,4-dihydroxy-2-naphthoate octaprenyltransferase
LRTATIIGTYTAYTVTRYAVFFCQEDVPMKRVVGYTLFWFALGMLVMLILPNDFLGILIIAVCLFLGYYFCSC